MRGEFAAEWAVSRHVVVGGSEMRYREAGRGAPLVLVHGLGVSADYWFRNGAPLAGRGFRVLAPDLPGFGLSPAGRAAADDPVKQAAALGRWADTLGLPAAVFAGHSLSCQSVLQLAADRPEIVTGLVLTGPTGEGAPLARARQLVLLAIDGPLESPRLVTTAMVAYLRAGPVRVFRTWWRGAHHDPLPLAVRVRAPGIVIVGSRDPIVNPGFAERLAAALRGGRVVWIEGGTHAVHHSHATEFNDAVVAFASSLDRGGRAS